MQFPNIDPTIIKIAGPFAVRWYAIPYLATALLARFSILRANGIRPFCSEEQINDACSTGLLGLVCGARLAYVLFYDPMYYAKYPMEVLMIWKGGLSFHGGVIGLILSIVVYSKRKGINPARILDASAFVIPFGLFFGRIANFINAELYGRATNLPIGMIFPTDPYKIARHPSQLYEAGLEGLVLGGIMMAFMFHKRLFNKFFYKDYHIGTIWLVGYSIFRFFCEFFREPDSQFGLIFGMTVGQLLSVLYSIIGVLYVIRKRKNETNLPNSNNGLNSN